MTEQQPERKVIWVHRWLSGGTPESRCNVPVLMYVEDDWGPNDIDPYGPGGWGEQ